jgi:hypothetical protein
MAIIQKVEGFKYLVKDEEGFNMSIYINADIKKYREYVLDLFYSEKANFALRLNR